MIPKSSLVALGKRAGNVPVKDGCYLTVTGGYRKRLGHATKILVGEKYLLSSAFNNWPKVVYNINDI